jgi:CelD/BcsL family acetyltransferase involved in cellulose biosynthesis
MELALKPSLDPGNFADGAAVPCPRTLAVVVITRNESQQIAGCLESVLAATRDLPDTQVVVVDSDSTDDTVVIAGRYPVDVYRYRGPRMSAAAGRRIGLDQVAARYVFFIDGDCRVAPGWIASAIEILERDPTVGIVCGGRQNAYLGDEGLDFKDVGCALGGTALYRRDVLVRAGGFNPFITGAEEQELLARILALGYHKVATPQLMAVHYTGMKESVDGLWRRQRSGMLGGPGEVLRASLSTGTFPYHAREFNRYLLTFAFIAVGVICALAEIWEPAFLLIWLAVGWIAGVALSVRRRSIREAMFIVADWVLVAMNGVVSFARVPRMPESFTFELERIEPNGGATQSESGGVDAREVASEDVRSSVPEPLPVDELLRSALREEWDALIASSSNLYRQYQSPEWVAHLRACYPERLLDPVVVRAADGRLAGILPTSSGTHELTFHARDYVAWKSTLRSVAILGGTPLLPPNERIFDEAFLAASRLRSDADCLYLHSVPVGSFCWRYVQTSRSLRNEFRVYVPEVRPFHTLELPATFDAYLAKFKHKKRYNLARQERLLREHGGGHLELRRVETRDQLAGFHDAVTAVSQDSWQGRAAIPEAYAVVKDRLPFEDLARRGLVRSYVLECGGEPVAFVLGYQFGDIFHYAEIAYRQSVQRFSPGPTLLYMLIRDLVEHRRRRIVNFGIGDAPYKREFGNLQTRDASVLLLRKSVRLSAICTAHRLFHSAVRSAGRRLRKSPG